MFTNKQVCLFDVCLKLIKNNSLIKNIHGLKNKLLNNLYYQY